MSGEPVGLEPVRAGVAQTQAEREACFALRYRVYVEEFGCDVPTADHRRKLDRTGDDVAATQIYASRGSKVIGTMRLHHGATSALPQAFLDGCEPHLYLPATPLAQMMGIGRLAIDASERGGAAIAPLFRECFRWLRENHPETKLAFILAIEEQRLLALYRLLGFKPIDPDRRIRVDVGICVPMVLRLAPGIGM